MPPPTPYDGSSTPFTIGLRPLDPARWIEVGEDYATQLAEKRRLFATVPAAVLAEEDGTRASQREVLDRLTAHLEAIAAGHPRGDGIRAALAAAHSAAPGDPPLKTAALLVQEDLVLMRRDDRGWRLAAAALCFPSSWTLSEKFGRPLDDIHGPVPGFGRGTRTAKVIDRIFDNLRPGQPVERMNWSLQADDALYKPMSSVQRDERARARPPRFPGDDPVAVAFVRVERQTLTRLPVSGDILFTIRIFLDPLGVLASHPERPALCRSFAAQLAGLDAAQLDYKGIAADRDGLVAALERMAQG